MTTNELHDEYRRLIGLAEKADRHYRRIRGIGTNAEIDTARAALSLATRKAEDARRTYLKEQGR